METLSCSLFRYFITLLPFHSLLQISELVCAFMLYRDLSLLLVSQIFSWNRRQRWLYGYTSKSPQVVARWSGPVPIIKRFISYVLRHNVHAPTSICVLCSRFYVCFVSHVCDLPSPYQCCLLYRVLKALVRTGVWWQWCIPYSPMLRGAFSEIYLWITWMLSL